MNLAIAKAHGQAKSNFGTIANTDIALLIVSLAAVLLQCSLAWLTTLYVHPVIALCTDSSLKLHLYSDHIIYISGSNTLYFGIILDAKQDKNVGNSQDFSMFISKTFKVQ